MNVIGVPGNLRFSRGLPVLRPDCFEFKIACFEVCDPEPIFAHPGCFVVKPFAS